MIRLILLTAISLIAWGQIAQEPTGSLSGRVVNSVTGEPVKKAQIQIQPNGMVRGRLTGPMNAVTDASGRFAIRQLPPGQYRIWAQHPNYPRSRQNPMGEGTDATVTEGSAEKDVTVSLVPGASISGRVTDQDGEPLLCSVQLLEMSVDTMPQGLMPMQGANVDERGEFRIFNVPPGRYFLQARSQRPVLQARPLMTQAEVLKQPTLSYVPVFYPNSPTAQGAAAISIQPGAAVQGIEFRLVPVRTVSISGKLIFPPDAASSLGTSISLAQRRTDGSRDLMPVSSTGARPPRQEFVLQNVPSGSYTLEAVSQSPEQVYVAMQQLEVGSDPLTDVTVSMKASVDLSVTIVVEKSRQQSTQQYMQPPSPPGQQIWVNPASNARSFSVPQVEAKPDGTILLRKVTPGRWEIGAPTGYVKSMRLGNRDFAGSTLEIAGGESGVLEVTVSERYGEVRGMVQGVPPGKMTMGALINLKADPYSQRRLQIIGVHPDGQFQSRVPPGEYRFICVDGIDANRLQHPGLRDWLARHGTSVTVEAEGTASASATIVQREAVEQALREAFEKIAN